MAQKHNSDYIPTNAELERAAEERKEWQRTHEDPRKLYECRYNVNGTPITEKILAVNIKEAEATVRQQCGMVGWIPMDLVVLALENTNEEVK